MSSCSLPGRLVLCLVVLFFAWSLSVRGIRMESLREDTSLFRTESRLSRLSLLEKLLGLLLLVALVVVIVLVVVVVLQKREGDDEASGSAAIQAARIHGTLDFKADPCEDFYQFACGRWLKEHVIPEDKGQLTVFTILRNEVNIILKNLLETEISSEDPDYIVKTKNFYASCMDTDVLERKGDQALKDLLEQEFGGWPLMSAAWDDTKFDLTDLLSTTWRIGNRALFNFYVTIDQPSFGMPGQKYYLVPRNDTMLMAYQNLIVGVAKLLGVNDTTLAEKDIKDLVDFEIKLAEISVPDEERRDANALYNPTTLQELHDEYKQVFDWKAFTKGLFGVKGVNVAVEDQELIINRSPPFFKKFIALLENTPKRVQANYIIWRVVSYWMGKLTEDYRKLSQVYNEAVLGMSLPSARYETCCEYTTNYLGLAVGKLFIKDNFNDEAKTQALEMIGNLQEAFDELLGDLDWMEDETKAMAKDKNKYINSKIGYQEEIRNDTFMSIFHENYTYTSDEFFNNLLNDRKETFKVGLRRLREPVNKNEWLTAPSTVNAFYSASENRIVFPAGIFQPPFFSGTNPKSLNYGGIGVVIGHEITHGFDDRGRQYDRDGNLVQWWSQSAIDKFKAKTQCLVEQYGNFTVERINMNLNGINTLGENIADNGGLKQSFKAYRNWVASQGKEESQLPGLNFSHNQLFFINFAQLWCSLRKDANYVNSIRTGVHSPGQFRVVGTLQNTQDFSEAFKCKQGSAMTREHKCNVW